MSNVFSEVYAVLLALGDDFVSRIPSDIMANIKGSAKTSKMPNIDSGLPINKQGLSNDAMAMLACIKKDYWMTDEAERQDFIDCLKKSEHEFNERVSETTSTMEILNMLKADK